VRKLRLLSLLALGILVCALVFAGCSGSNTIAVTLSTPETSLNPGQTATITATLTNDTNNQGVTWSLTGVGALSGNTTTSVVYTAPTSISVSTTATITATSVANTTITATQSVTLNAVLTITTTSLPAGILGVPYDSFVNAAGAPAPFTWTVISGSLPPGLTFLPTSTSTSAEITGTPTVLGTSNFTVQVTDSSDASVTQALSITVNRPPPLSVATGSLPDGTVNTKYSQTLEASSGVQPYTWSLIDGTTLPLGFVSPLPPSGLISGTPVVSGTFPFTVQVKDSSTPTPQTATANLSITINQGVTTNSLLNGNYAFSVRGFDENGLFVAVGSFIADGMGNISAGVMDTNDTMNPSLNQSFSGTYSINRNGLGSLILTLSPTASRTFELSMLVGGNANIVEFDDTGGFAGNSARNSGVLLRQDPTVFTKALGAGGYAFGFLGIDSGRNRFGLAGEFQSDGAGNFTSGLLDSDDARSGTSGSVPFISGGYTVSPNGRWTANIKTAQGTTGYSFYVVNLNELLVVETDAFSTGGYPLVSGTILQQSNVSLGDGSLTGLSVFEVTALNASTAESQVGLFSGNGSGGFSLTSDQNIGGTLTSEPLMGSGSYSVDPTTGRVTVTLLSGSGFQNSQPVFYLVTTNQAFIIGTDPEVSSGFVTPQSGSPFTPASLSGTYAGGSLAPVDSSVSNVVSTAVAGSGTLNVTAYASGPNGLSFNQDVETTAVASDGRVVVTQNQGTVDILYLVSPAEFFSLSADPTARVDIFQQ
jgi:hypothetical protein